MERFTEVIKVGGYPNDYGVKKEILLRLQVSRLKRRYDTENVIVVYGNLYGFIAAADLLVTSYSTTGDEAIALGCPVISYTGIRPTIISSYLDIEAAPLVHSPEELEHALEKMLYDDEYKQHYMGQRDKLIEGSFYKLDGLAKKRFSQALLQISQG